MEAEYDFDAIYLLEGLENNPLHGLSVPQTVNKEYFLSETTPTKTAQDKRKKFTIRFMSSPMYLSLDLRGLLLDAYTNEVIVGPVFMMFTCVIHNVVANRK